MTRPPAPFRQRDVTRALKAAAAAGLQVVGFKIDPQTGTIAVEVGSSEAQGDAPAQEGVNEWDQV
jgi:hypothetical protein